MNTSCFHCSTCLKVIRTDSLARQHFHPKHTKDSQALKNVAEYVIKCVQKLQVEGFPEWYLENLPVL
jgi:hypothetical protein